MTVTPMSGVAVVAGAARVDVRQRLPAASMVKTEECMVVPMIERNTNWNVGFLGVQRLRIEMLEDDCLVAMTLSVFWV